MTSLFLIGGAGRVGLPFGLSFLKAGCEVTICDTDESKLSMLREGKMPFMEDGAQELLDKHYERLQLTNDISGAKDADYIAIMIGTPVDEYLNPRLSHIFQVAGDLVPWLSNGQTLVLRSTVFPGTTTRLEQFFRDKGRFVNICFCPERILQGKAIFELPRLPQIVSGVTPNALLRSKALFALLGVRTITLTPLEAELTKLYSNAYRYVQFAASNKFYEIARDAGADFNAIHDALTSGYPRMAGFPREGFAAGPCLMKDTMQLSSFSEFGLGEEARLVNEGLPAYLVRKLKDKFGDLKEHTIGLLGMAFKGDIDDGRDSLAYKLGKLLRFEGAEVVYSDEFIKDDTFIPKEELLAVASILVVCAPHSAYRGLDTSGIIHVEDIWDCL